MTGFYMTFLFMKGGNHQMSDSMVDVIGSFHGDYAFLSSFYRSPFTFNSIRWPAAEYPYQFGKCVDIWEAAWILQAPDSGTAKRRGNMVKLRPGWDEVKVDLMREIIFCKFTQSKDLLNQLIATGNAELIEGNTWGDTFWGCTPDGKGQNMLGKLLMDLRENLRLAQ